ncbi:hypothetical protein FKP32DRAFT_1756093 [Trametes sanguinea]|nr:hypothetical protein FKP32DRAFT_1756093 [Trametes sanguinea]
MSSYTATNTTLAGLGLSFDTLTVNSDFSSEESFDSLFSHPSSQESQVDDAQTGSAPETGDHWQVTYAEDAEPDFNYFEPYLGVPEVSDFVPWPTSPELAAELQDNRASPSSEVSCRPPQTPAVERGYEADTDSPRALRRQRRRDVRKAARRQHTHYLVDRVQPIIEDLPSLEEIQRRIDAYSSPQPQHDHGNIVAVDETTIGLGFDFSIIDENEIVEPTIHDTTILAEQDITETTHNHDSNLDSESAINHDDDAYTSCDSDDSDVDHYYYELDMENEHGDNNEVHYLVQHVRPIIEELPTLEELQARMGTISEETSQAALVGLGLGLPNCDEDHSLPAYPSFTHEEHAALPEQHTEHAFLLDLTAPAPMSNRYDGFETIDLTDQVSSPPLPHRHEVPDSPDLRPHLAAESPSPIVLASPMPLTPFRTRVDDVLHHNPWSDSLFSSEADIQYAARHPLARES